MISGNQPIEIITVENEDKISSPARKLELEQYPDVSPQRAWELANLIRIAGTDYECFNDWFNRETESQQFVLEENRSLQEASETSWLYTGKVIAESTLREYWLFSNKVAAQEKTQQEFPDEKFFKYKILKTYEFVSFYPFKKKKVNIDRFGFIAERTVGNKKLIFIVFRGTRELSEWFNNSQFRQVRFLETAQQAGIENCGKISQGFNKMYTEFRPGILNDWGAINMPLRNFDRMARDYFRKNGRELADKPIVKAINEFYLETSLENADIYIAGHSLGGALASIATLDLVATNYGFTGKAIEQSKQGKISSPIHLYTFASPRVGDNFFADKFNDCISCNYIKAFRFANSEDLVTNIPFSVWFKAGIDLDGKFLAALGRSVFNRVTGGIFEKDYQHVGLPVYFTHQARRFKDSQKVDTATIGDNHNMTASYCRALPKKSTIE